MGFLAPWMLFGAAAVSVPIILHFFFRSRYRTVQWAAMKFLLNSIEQTSRRLKFQEILLLILRCLVLATLALAMARPISSTARGTGRGDAVDAIFLMDVSYSMGANDGDNKSRLERAKAAAIEVLDKLPAHSTVRIVATSNRAELVGPRSPSNLDQGRELIKNLEVTSLSTDFAPSVTEAKKLLEQCQLPNKELYLFSDMQKLGWTAQESQLVSEFKDIKDKANVFMVRCGTRQPKNAEIIGITPQVGVPRPGERIGFAVLVRNTGGEELKDVVVTLAADPVVGPGGEEKEKVETQTITSLKPGETRPVTLTAKFEKAGSRVLTARIRQDDIPGDNRYDQVIPVRETVNVLVVNGGMNERDPAKSSSYYVNHALLPIKDTDRAKYFLQIQEVEPRLASPALLAKADIVFLINVSVSAEEKRIDAFGKRNIVPAAFVNDLNGWVSQGHGLVIIPGENTVPEAYNKALGSLLPYPIGEKREFDEKKKAVHVSRLTFNLPAFMKFKEDSYFTGFDSIQVAKIFELKEKESEKDKDGKLAKDLAKQIAQDGEAKEKGKDKDKEKEKLDKDKNKETVFRDVVLRYDNDMAAIASRRVDRGEVFFFTTSADKVTEPTWSDWPFSPNFIPLIQTLFAHMLQDQTQNLNVVAGQPLTLYPQDKEIRRYDLQEPDGKRVPLELPVVRDNRQILALPVMDKAGVYRLVKRTVTTDDKGVPEAGVPIAVIPDLRESVDFDALTNEQIDGRLGFPVTHYTADQRMETGGSTLDRFQREWTLWILALVLVLMFGESTLAWICGRAW